MKQLFFTDVHADVDEEVSGRVVQQPGGVAGDGTVARRHGFETKLQAFGCVYGVGSPNIASGGLFSLLERCFGLFGRIRIGGNGLPLGGVLQIFFKSGNIQAPVAVQAHQQHAVVEQRHHLSGFTGKPKANFCTYGEQHAVRTDFICKKFTSNAPTPFYASFFIGFAGASAVCPLQTNAFG
jgi:hypothetical protein